jgi:hypothetical protein
MTIKALESAIVARLQARLGANVRHVYTAAEVAQVEERSQVVPSVAVIYNGMTPTQEVGHGMVQEVALQFLAVVTTRNARQSGTQDGAREDAAELVDAVLEALLGFRPLPNCGPLKLEQAPGAGFTDAGFAYYPLAFEIRRSYRGTP